MRLPLALAAVAVLAACGSSTDNSGAPGPQQLGLSVSTTGGATANAAGGTGTATALASAPGTEVIVAGTDTLTLTKVQLVLRKIRLVQGDSTGRRCDDDDERESADSSTYCPVIKLGPILVDLPLGDTTAKRQFLARLPIGTYVKAKLKVHQARQPRDSAFIRANPALDSASIRVEGSYKGQPFVFKSRVESEQEFRLNPPLVVSDTAGTNLTLKVELGRWFLGRSGGIIDPRTAALGTDANRQIASNIRRSFRSFEDKDRDGCEDRGEKGGDRGRGGDGGNGRDD